MCDSGPGADNTNYGAIKQEKLAAAQQLALQQAQWQAAQAAGNQSANVNSQVTQKAINDATNQNTQQAQNWQQGNIAQGAAQNATGGPSGIKAAATVAGNTLSQSPADAKLQAAGLAIPGVDSLTNFLKQRSLSQSNNVGTGNQLQSSGTRLGG